MPPPTACSRREHRPSLSENVGRLGMLRPQIFSSFLESPPTTITIDVSTTELSTCFVRSRDVKTLDPSSSLPFEGEGEDWFALCLLFVPFVSWFFERAITKASVLLETECSSHFSLLRSSLAWRISVSLRFLLFCCLFGIITNTLTVAIVIIIIIISAFFFDLLLPFLSRSDDREQEGREEGESEKEKENEGRPRYPHARRLFLLFGTGGGRVFLFRPFCCWARALR